MASSSKGSRPHDIRLVDALAGFAASSYEAVVYRATRLNADPTAFSTAGGRWAPPATWQEVQVLYTSLEREGAIAEVASYLAELTPRPKKEILVHKLRVTASNVVQLNLDDLLRLGVKGDDYRQRIYAKPGEEPMSRTQEIGAALNFLERDGLLVPSARRDCENLIIFGDNHKLSERLEAEFTEEEDWVAWAERLGILDQ
jgi:hypothetical protein